VIHALLLTLSLAHVPDSLPRITLGEAISRAAQLNPDYVRAAGQVDNAEWGRRAAIAAFVLPSITATVDATKYSTAFFNIGTSRLQSQVVNAQLTAQYELFSLRKLSDLGRTRAELESAEATQSQQRFRTALLTEGDYYEVLRNRELARVATERVRRAAETPFNMVLEAAPAA
jgi:outer membrane protein TolC